MYASRGIAAVQSIVQVPAQPLRSKPLQAKQIRSDQLFTLREVESPTYTRALHCGSQRRNSRIQLGTVLRGTTTRNGPATACAHSR